MPKKPTKKKTITKSKVKKEAWGAFSKYIRLRDGLISMGSKETGKCFTCGRVTPLFTLYGGQAGHFIDGRGNAVLFEEELVHLQCRQCNLFKHGNKEAYETKMVELYGSKKVEALKQLRHTTKEYTKEDYERIRDFYKEEFKGCYENN
ncbi:MAG: hypothetical protein UW63_C0087G0007 [Candidatus Uhrbacteria bacterium GW2011_GWF2_44_350]|uniref:Uncharacterized protein n=1 Tax=Candidatus Uhrbacteria bacterium GW2011_GWF2_44_350 TaxID=1619000 RepID=A0A0G1LHB2_9BACT|nr:MAG: hypothetical protein UW63_C0087G0007 [Candidatus Uhrbacteria bacterium GW2011_GWF2_44_350]